MTINEQFKSLFEGNDAAHYSYDTSTKEYLSVPRAIELADIERHLRGEQPGLLSIPINADGNSFFGCIDVDRHLETDDAIDHAALARRVTELSLPLVVTRSKSPKSAHLWLFLKNTFGFPSCVVRQLLFHYVKMLEITGEVEIFSKQDVLKPDKPGSGINLPFFGDSRTAFGKDGGPLDLAAFIALATERSSFGEILQTRDLTNVAQPEIEKSKTQGPLTIISIRAIHKANLIALRASTTGGNNLLNKISYFAGRAFAAGAFEESEATIKTEIQDASVAAGVPLAETRSTAKSGWDAGILEPLIIRASIENPKDIVSGLDAFTYFQDNFFFVEDFGGHVRVMWNELDPNPAFAGRLRLGHQSPTEFASRYSHLTIAETYTDKNGEEQTKDVPITDYWMWSREHRQYKTIVFAPGVDLDPYILNLWNGFSVKPVAGDCSKFLSHLDNVICAGDESLSTWLKKQLAYWAQFPGRQGYIAIVLQGGKGTGKNMFVEYYGDLWGSHFLTVSRGDQVGGRFNRHMMTTSILHANEAYRTGDANEKQMEASVKTLITDPTLAIEAKGVDLIQAPNMVHMFISSNSPWSIPASLDERRFAVLKLAKDHTNDFPYFAALDYEKEHGGKEALLHLLLNMDLTGFNPRSAPVTKSLHEQMGHSLEGMDAVWHEYLMLGILPNGIQDEDRTPMFGGGMLVRSFDLLDWAKSKRMTGSREINAQNLGLCFRSNPRGTRNAMGFMNDERRVNPITMKVERFWRIPKLSEARILWNELRFPEEWGDPNDVWESVEYGFIREKRHD